MRADAEGKADTSPEALKKLVNAFSAYKVTKEQIEKRIQRRLDTITAAQLVQLRKVYNSLKDGMSSPADWFEMDAAVEAPDKAASLKDKVRARREKKAEPADVPVPEEMAPGPCPNNGDDIYTKKHCDACPDREGCPVW